MNNNTAFTFVVEHLVGAIVGTQKWKTTRSYAPVSKHMSVSDEAFMLLVLENQYNLWMESATSRVGQGKYIENAPKRKSCGWSNERMRQFSKLLEDMHTNRNKQYSKDVEGTTFKTLAERYKTIMAVTGKNGWKHHHCHCMSAHLEEEDEKDDDDSSVIPQDALILLVNLVGVKSY